MEMVSKATVDATGIDARKAVRAGFKDGWTLASFKSRIKAASIHFLISAMVGLCITLPIIFWLYPSPFFEAAGGLSLLGILLAVDVVIGPVLTFFVFDRRKASLKKDLSVIGLLQLVSLAYGLHVTSLSRPVFMTYVVDRFELVSAAEVDYDELKKAPQGFQKIGWGHPVLAYAESPKDPDEKLSLIMAATQSGVDLKHTFRYYKPFGLSKAQIVSRAKPISDLKLYNRADVVDTILREFQHQDLAFVPLQAKKRDLTALVGAKSGVLIKVVDLRPWK